MADSGLPSNSVDVFGATYASSNPRHEIGLLIDEFEVCVERVRAIVASKITTMSEIVVNLPHNRGFAHNVRVKYLLPNRDEFGDFGAGIRSRRTFRHC